MWPLVSASACHDAGAGACAVPASAVVSLVPFAATFALVNVLAVRHLFPTLSCRNGFGSTHLLPDHAPTALRCAHAEYAAKSWRRRAIAWTFGTTIALAVTLGLLIMAEIVDVTDAAARELALSLTVPALLCLLVLLIPWLVCRSAVAAAIAAGWFSHREARGACALQLLLFSAWLLVFWSVGSAVPGTDSAGATATTRTSKAATSTAAAAVLRPLSETWTRACLERIGVVGISLMALLAGFASVSSPCHTLLDSASRRRRRPLSEADINRKQVGLDSAHEMLLAKRLQLQTFERKVSQQSTAGAGGYSGGGHVGLVSKVLGVGGGGKDEAEMRTLRVEIAGLEAMEVSLAQKLSRLRNDLVATTRSSTCLGRLLAIPSYAFSSYCLYRIVATALATTQRLWSPSSSSSFSSSDPISRFLGLVVRHWDPALDQLAWARIISFALSGVILLACANSAVQTLRLFTKWTPGLLRHAQANLALVVGQMAATYVISASLLLRGQLPANAGGAAVGSVLHGALSPQFVDNWFEAWFLTGSALTATGLWVGRWLAGGDEEDWWCDDGYDGEEAGTKRQ